MAPAWGCPLGWEPWGWRGCGSRVHILCTSLWRPALRWESSFFTAHLRRNKNVFAKFPRPGGKIWKAQMEVESCGLSPESPTPARIAVQELQWQSLISTNEVSLCHSVTYLDQAGVCNEQETADDFGSCKPCTWRWSPAVLPHHLSRTCSVKVPGIWLLSLHGRSGR